MTTSFSPPAALELSGLDGANPLGFLAALGALMTAHAAGETEARLRWTRSRTWVPVLDGFAAADAARLCETLAAALSGKEVSPEADEKRRHAEEAFKNAKSAKRKKQNEIRKKGLKGDERKAAVEAHVRPLEMELERRRKEWLEALREAVPRRELALGTRIDCTGAEYREHAESFRDELDHRSREALDLLAAFGSDACRMNNSDAIEPTPFCFIRGSGQQFFLDTVRQLIAKVEPERLRQTLFEPWAYRDEKLSMRWNPLEDRRYAFMDRDPSASNNKSRTIWMANLLAYRGLASFVCAPTNRGLGTTGWSRIGEAEVFTWPIWEFPALPDVIRSMLQLRELAEQPSDRTPLRARGITVVFRARRIKVGAGANYKLNFSPARAVRT